MDDLRTKRVVVTGGRGFLGKHLARILNSRGWMNVLPIDKSDYDLTEPESIRALIKDLTPEIIIHLAAVVGGIGANRKHPGLFFYENAVMGIHLMEEARKGGVEKFVQIGTVCAYPKFTPVPFSEDELWNGYPEETNAPYGLAKKMLLVQAQAYRAEYEFNAIYLLPVNLFGPGDNFDPESSHVIPALIRKFTEAVREKRTTVEIWGTGMASREFLYVEDAAEAIAMATERYDGAEPVNIGAGFEMTIADLAKLIAEKCHYRGEICFNPQHPDGQPRRCLDISRAERLFGFRARTPFETGLDRTVKWFKENHRK